MTKLRWTCVVMGVNQWKFGNDKNQPPEHRSGNWRLSVLPGLIGIGLVIAARLAGILQPLEWMSLDYLLRLRPPESLDEQITIIGIDEADIRAIGSYPVPGKDLAELLRQIQSYNPAIIGLDIFRDLPVEPGHADLLEVFQTSDTIIGIEKIVPDRTDFTVDPPDGLPSEQVGFADAVLDADGNLRRSLLGATTVEGEYRFSLTLKLAETYLASYGFVLENGIRDPSAMRFGSVEIPQVTPNMGGYVRVDDRGYQTLLNFRSGSQPFRILSLDDVRSNQFEAEWIRDRIVLIGATAVSAADYVNSNAVATSNPGLVYGVEIQAHAVSQIINAVLNDRPLLRGWPDGWEYLWIIGLGLAGIGLGRVTRSPIKHMLLVAGISIGLIGLGYVALVYGWWLPIVPGVIVFVLNGAVFHAFYLYDRSLRSLIEERQAIIDRTYDAIHNGPLQTLAHILRGTRSQTLPSDEIPAQLDALNQELRDIYELMRQEALTQDYGLYLGGDRILKLDTPLHELLYEVYNNTLQREFPYFKTIKVHITKFEPLDERFLSIHQKRDLCRFLEEALCNVGKHAVDTTRLTIICKQDHHQNIIQVIDNGTAGLNQTVERLQQTGGRGTQQATELARRLNGHFRRSPHSSKGTVCELRWTVRSPWWKGWQFSAR
ncbi:MAG: CHASE2 domain-containing protein [Elainellaceae cyanobacterium]